MTTTQQQAVIYCRVSTTKQGVSGLGLEAQLATARNYCAQYGLTVLKEYHEIKSGKRNDRELIAQALDLCELTHSKLVVAKLDRISRDVEFIAQLQKSKVQFVCADMPEANSLIIGFMAQFAQYEREMASMRTKAAMQVLKDQGKKLGNPNIHLLHEAYENCQTIAARKRMIELASDRNFKVAAHIREAMKDGHETLQAIANYLNTNQIKTARGKNWTPSGVRIVKNRFIH